LKRRRREEEEEEEELYLRLETRECVQTYEAKSEGEGEEICMEEEVEEE
jgi:hypothetical protein